jgi:integrase
VTRAAVVVRTIAPQAKDSQLHALHVVAATLGVRRGEPDRHTHRNRDRDKLRVRAGLPTLPLYDLRHTCVSLLLSLGVHPRW